jgi:hypothetical protein
MIANIVHDLDRNSSSGGECPLVSVFNSFFRVRKQRCNDSDTNESHNLNYVTRT